MHSLALDFTKSTLMQCLDPLRNHYADFMALIHSIRLESPTITPAILFRHSRTLAKQIFISLKYIFRHIKAAFVVSRRMYFRLTSDSLILRTVFHLVTRESLVILHAILWPAWMWGISAEICTQRVRERERWKDWATSKHIWLSM